MEHTPWAVRPSYRVRHAPIDVDKISEGRPFAYCNQVLASQITAHYVCRPTVSIHSEHSGVIISGTSIIDRKDTSVGFITITKIDCFD